jgi:hypothetical protein
MRIFISSLFLAGSAVCALGATTIDAANKYAYGANLG